MLFTFPILLAIAFAEVQDIVPAVEVSEPNPTVMAGNATYVGLWENKNHSRVFYGIRFAKPPINELRFRPPVPLEQEGVINATEQGNRCHQALGITTLLTRIPQSEDCLNLNVFTPTNASNLPVFVYIFGGGFSGQSIQDPMYDGNRLLARTKDVVIVAMNYRQAAFGFLASEQLMRENGGSLNVGLLDQVVALEWIKKNIAAFGGDPNRITAAGQSAGALSIAAHMLANEGKQEYFQRAVLMGGNIMLQISTAGDREGQYQKAAESVNCPIDENTLRCLRSVDAETLSKQNAKTDIIWGLTADNYVVENQIAALQQGKFSKIPVFLNTDKDEGTFFALVLGATNDRKTNYLFDTLSPIFADRLDKLFSFYPRKTRQAHWQFGDAFGDFWFQCPTYLFARTLDQHQEVYVSRFNRIIQSINLLWIESNLLGVAHASEVPHLWLAPILALPADKRQAERFHDAVMNFVKGNPPMNAIWPTYNGGKNRFDIANLKLESDFDRSAKCEFMVKAASDFYNDAAARTMID